MPNQPDVVAFLILLAMAAGFVVGRIVFRATDVMDEPEWLDQLRWELTHTTR